MDVALVRASIEGDIKNGYNEVEKENVMREVKGCGQLDDTFELMQTLLELCAYVGMGKGTNLVIALFIMEEGVQQGVVQSKCFQSYRRMLAEHVGGGDNASHQ